MRLRGNGPRLATRMPRLARDAGGVFFVLFILACPSLSDALAADTEPRQLRLDAYTLSRAYHAAALFADLRTTDIGLSRPGVWERNPILGKHPSDLRLYATGVVGGMLVQHCARRLRVRHPRAAVWMLVAVGSLHAYLAVHNSRVSDD